MIVKEKNQNYIMNQDLINSFEIDYIFENKPINRFKSKPTIEITNSKLNDLQVKIKNISNCELKKRKLTRQRWGAHGVLAGTHHVARFNQRIVEPMQ